MKAKILVCCHKQDICETNEPFLPIQVGKAISNVDLGILGDDTEDNISAKNSSYCELTGMYWAWKNISDADIIGLCHYRRYFDFHSFGNDWAPYSIKDTDQFPMMDRSIPTGILDKVRKGAVVIAKPTNCQLSIMADYCCIHNSDDFKVLHRIVCETQPDQIKRAFFKVMYCSNTRPSYNMFIMRKDDFDSYCQWLFDLLSNVERQIDITHYSAKQRRIFGYMGERLFKVWLLANEKKTIKKPVVWFADCDDPMRHSSMIKYAIRCALNNISVFLARPRYVNVMRADRI